MERILRTMVRERLMVISEPKPTARTLIPRKQSLGRGNSNVKALKVFKA